MSEMEQRTVFLLHGLCFHATEARRGFLRLRPEWRAVFTSWDASQEYLKTVCRLDMERYGNELHRQYRIVETVLNPERTDYKAILHHERRKAKYWDYSAEGKLVYTRGDPELQRSEFERFDYEGKYKIGDIVCVPPTAQEPYSASLEGGIGVVIKVPSGKQEWIRSARNPSEWRGRYDVLYVPPHTSATASVLWDALPERYLMPLRSGLPEQLLILDIWSHMLKRSADADSLDTGDVFWLNVEVFDFSEFESHSEAPNTKNDMAARQPSCGHEDPTQAMSRGGERQGHAERSLERADFVINNTNREGVFLVQCIVSFDDTRSRGFCHTEGEWEAVFSSWDDARSFLDMARRDYGERIIGASTFFYQIEEVFLDPRARGNAAAQDAPARFMGRCWCFNVEGDLLWTWPDPEQDRSEFDRFEFEGRYHVGDLVYLVPQAQDPESESIEGDFGVVVGVPEDKQEWLRRSKDPAEWDGCYVVHYVDDYGYLARYHAPERCLTPPMTDLPKELKFLGIWSRALKGTVQLASDLEQRILDRKIFLRNVPRYDFSKGKVVAAYG